ncbi:hypothetical protein KC460_04195 [Candidatus Dependentiae bacterium]|nr:hypothetical protein [Candidatus Dependentiae bacterium]
MLFFLFFIPFFSYAFIYHDFDDAMQISRYPNTDYAKRTFKEVGVSADDILDFFRNLYNNNSFRELLQCAYTESLHVSGRDFDKQDQGSMRQRIPKIIHQIWIGTEVPQEFRAFQQSWKLIHPDWCYRLWTQDDIRGFGFKNIEYITKSRNPAEISDMMRYEILYRYGGVYVDMDQECLRAFDELHRLFDFYIGIQPLDSGMVQLGIGVIGSVPGHPLVRELINAIKYNWQQFEGKQAVTQRTGPVLCTKVFLKYAKSVFYKNIALPALYFYPLGSQEYDIDKTKWVASGSLAVHYWAKTWLLPSFRRAAFKGIKNY